MSIIAASWAVVRPGPMFGLGQNRKSSMRAYVSAVHPTTDIAKILRHAHLVPLAAIGLSVDHLIGAPRRHPCVRFRLDWLGRRDAATEVLNNVTGLCARLRRAQFANDSRDQLRNGRMDWNGPLQASVSHARIHRVEDRVDRFVATGSQDRSA